MKLNQERRVRAGLDALVGEGVLSSEQVDAIERAVLAALAEPAPRRITRWAEAVAYIGGALVLAGGVVLVGPAWTELRQGLRVGLLGFITVLLLGVAVWAAGGSAAVVRRRATAGTVRIRAASVLWTLGAGTAAIGAGQLQTGHELFVGSTVGLVVAVVGYAWLPGPLGLVAIGVLGTVALRTLLQLLHVRSDVTIGVALIAEGAVFLALVLSAVLGPRMLGFGIGSILALAGAQYPALASDTDIDAVPYLLTFAVALGIMILYVRENAWVLLVAAIVGITLAVPQAVFDLTDSAVGGGLMVVLVGSILLVAGVMGLAWHRRVSQRHNHTAPG